MEDLFAFGSWYAKLLAYPLDKHVIDIIVHRDYGSRTVHCIAKLGVTSLLPTSGKTTVLV